MPIYELAHHPENQKPFYTMRFIKGRTLSEAVRAYHAKRKAGQANSLDLRELLNAFVAVCNAVAYAHSRGVIHRDLKGPNVVLGDYGEVMVLDWGLAKIMGRTDDVASQIPVALPSPPSPTDLVATLAGQQLGTPGYMAPEQAEGRLDLIDARSDVYGLGAILYEILTDQPPFEGIDAHDVLEKVKHSIPAPPREKWKNVGRQTPGVFAFPASVQSRFNMDIVS